MRFEVQREVMLKPLQQVVGVVERRQTLPVLGNVLVVATEEGVALTGTDLEVELVAHAEVEVGEPGETTLPARKLVDIFRALPDGARVEISTSNGRATVKAGRSRFTLATLPAEDFPRIEDVQLAQRVQLDRERFSEIIDRTAFAMAHQDVRYYLNGLLLELSSNQVRAVATDGHRLAICDMEAELAMEETQQIIVPRKGVHELERMLGDGETVDLEVGSSHVRVGHGAGTLTSKLIDGRFPDYEGVVPVGVDQQVRADRQAVREALQRAAILSNEKIRGVRLEVEPNELRIVAHNPEQEEAVEELEVAYEGDSLSLGFNVSYLLDALNALRGDEVLLCLRDSKSSCLLREIESERCRQVVMPIRL